MLKNLMKMALVATLAFSYAGAQAEDIDLFASPPSGGASNVLFIIDNAANFSASATHGCTYVDGGTPSLGNTTGGMEQCALYNAISSLKVNPDDGSALMNIGLMAFNANNFLDWVGYQCDQFNASGGCLMLPIQPLNLVNKALILAWIKTWDAPYKIKTNNQATGAVMQEAWAYFAGRTGISGRSYASIKPTSDCGRNYVIFVGNAYNNSGAPGDQTGNVGPKNALEGSNSNSDMNAFPAATETQQSIYLGPVAAANISMCSNSAYTFSSNNHENTGAYADEWARYMASPTTTNITTYTIGVHSAACKAEYAALLYSMATFGGGIYFPTTNFEQLEVAIGTALSQIQSENSAFASASLPVSVNAQGTYLNQVFIGMFRPEIKPRWYGNMKQYQFRADADADGKVVALRLVDKTNNHDAINPLNGFIDPCAQSFWSSADTYWPSGYAGSCVLTGLTDVRSNSPDGEIVEKGAIAQRLRAVSGASGASARNVKTCSGCGDNSALESLSTSNASVADLGAENSTEQSNLVDWARGQNVDDEVLTGNPNTITLTKGADAMRPSVHGDVVHSRPLAIDYGGTTGVVVFYGSNDGMLRAVNGNKADTAGNELWSFVAPEHLGKFKRLRSNSPLVGFPMVTGSPTPTAKDYFFDGPIGFYNNGSSKWIYPTMRRGGRMIYAFDVSTPTAPTLKWKRGPGELDNIGQTWSEPKVVKVAGYGLGASPVLIMGGGYDSCEDEDVAVNTACTAPKGNRIFVLNADNGTLLATLATDKSVAADVTVVDSDSDGLVDVAYAADTGGNLYRINIGAAAPGSWTIDKLAALGCTGGSCGRKFLHAPEVVTGTDFNAILLGSGNRERPLSTNQAVNVDNAFFMIKDDHSATPTVITTSALVAIDPDAALTTTQQADLALSTNKGWYLSFGSGDHDMEQVVTSAVVFAGVVYFSTHQPVTSNACGASLGTARGYAVNYLDASTPGGLAKFSVFAGGGLPPSPVTGVVTVSLTDSDNNTVKNPDGSAVVTNVPFIIGGGAPPPGPPGCGISGLSPCLVSVDPSPVRNRIFWYIQQ